MQLVGQPGDAVGRVVEDGRSHPRLLDHAVAVEQGPDPAHVHVHRLERPATHDDACVGCVVGDGVEHLAGGLGLRIDLLDARIDQFQRRRHIVRGREHVIDGAVGPAQRPGQHEGQFDLDARHDEAVGRDFAAFTKKHVIQQGARVGLGDVAGPLHGARGQPDLVSLERAAFGHLQGHPFALDGIGVGDLDGREALGELLHLDPGFFGLVQFAGKLVDDGGVEHGVGRLEVGKSCGQTVPGAGRGEAHSRDICGPDCSRFRLRRSG